MASSIDRSIKHRPWGRVSRNPILAMTNDVCSIFEFFQTTIEFVCIPNVIRVKKCNDGCLGMAQPLVSRSSYYSFVSKIEQRALLGEIMSKIDSEVFLTDRLDFKRVTNSRGRFTNGKCSLIIFSDYFCPKESFTYLIKARQKAKT